MTNLPPPRLLRARTVIAMTGIGRSTWWAGVRAQKYPQPIRIGCGLHGRGFTAWRAEDIERLIAEGIGDQPSKANRRKR